MTIKFDFDDLYLGIFDIEGYPEGVVFDSDEVMQLLNILSAIKVAIDLKNKIKHD